MTATLRSRFPLAALALLLSACAATNPEADARFGQSVRATMASQVAQPAAVRDARPVSGLDGRAARAAQEHYERSFGKAESGSSAPPGLVGTK